MYEGIYDIPTFNWWELNDTGNLDYLIKDAKSDFFSIGEMKINYIESKTLTREQFNNKYGNKKVNNLKKKTDHNLSKKQCGSYWALLMRSIDQKQVDLSVLYKTIKDQFFDEIALNPEIERYILKKAKLEEYRCNIILEIDPSYFTTLYLLLEQQLKSLDKSAANSGKRTTNLKTKAILQKSQGYYMDIKVIPIAEFHSIIDAFQDEQAEIRRENRRRAKPR